MRPIDADRLLEERRVKLYYHLPNGDIAIPIIDIEHAPTIEQPEIIRCRDCQYWESGTRYGKCKLTYISVTGDYYCAAAAERRGE